MLNKKTIAGTVVTVLVLLIFLSGTIYNFNTPAVTAVRPLRGYLNHFELTSGVVRYAETMELFSHLQGWIDEVLVREGDTITMGQPLIKMDFRGMDAETYERKESAYAQFQEQMDNLQINRARTLLDIERITANMSSVRNQIIELESDSLRQDAISDFDLMRSQRDVDNAIQNLSQIQTLYDAGVATRQELTNAENNLETQRQIYNNILRLYNESHERNYNQLSDWEASRERQIRDFATQIETLDRDLRSRNLDMHALDLQEETARREFQNSRASFRNQLEDFEFNNVITSPVNGIVTSIPVSQGQHIAGNQLIAAVGVVDYSSAIQTIGINGATGESSAFPFVVECEIPLSNNFVRPGSIALLYNSSHRIEGMVTQVVPLENFKRVTIAISSTQVAAGETFTIQFEETGRENFVLVPNGAINRDAEGYFVNQVRRRRGIMGEEFYTARVGINIGDSDNSHTAVLRGITFFEPIVLLSDRPFSTGETVILRNEGDFFENS